MIITASKPLDVLRALRTVKHVIHRGHFIAGLSLDRYIKANGALGDQPNK